MQHLQLPRSTVYQLLATLQESGFVLHYPEDRTYGLGFGAYELSAGYSRQAPLQRLARVPIATLRDRTRNSTHLGVLHGREVLYVLEERAPNRPLLITAVGVKLPAHITASGRALLAALPLPQVRVLYPDPASFAHRYPVGPTKLSELRSMLVDVRRLGYASEHGEVTPGLCSVATAVLDHTGYPLASIAVTYPEEHDSEQMTASMVKEVTKTAAELGRRVGGSLRLKASADH
jgi:DNA-binding IclR family transcriptional regulator